MENKALKIIMWVLFWWYLIPYYLLKKYIFHGKHGMWCSSAITILILFLGLGALGSGTSNDEADKASPKIEKHIVKKKVGQDRLTKAKKKSKVLAEEKKQKKEEYEKLQSELDDKKQEKRDQEQAEKEKQEEAQRQEEQRQKQQKQAQEKAAQQAKQNNSAAPTNHGDLDTNSAGTIVGNARSHIYHVPGQTGYHMNSANAVYFNSEQEAINAGYRKAKR